MDSLDLNIKERIWVHFDAVVLPNVLCQFLLVVLLNLTPCFAKLCILNECFKLLEVLQLLNPVVANLLGDELGELRITLQQPAAWSDPVGFVIEFLGPQLVEIPQDILIEQLRVQCCHTINRMAAHTR